MDWSSVLSGVSVGTVLAAAFLLYKVVNHRACRSTCCGHTASASLDVGLSPYATPIVPLHAHQLRGARASNQVGGTAPSISGARSLTSPSGLARLESSSGADDCRTMGIGSPASEAGAAASGTALAGDAADSASTGSL